MELPFHLKTLEPLPGALDILRYFGDIDEETADVDEICDALDLSDRRFNKAIRRLVTKGYVQMDGDGIYRLTEQGRDSVEELNEYDGDGGSDEEDDDSPFAATVDTVSRRLIIAMPGTLTAQHPTDIVVGFDEPEGDMLTDAVDLVLRVSVVNGGPEKAEDTLMKLFNNSGFEKVTITPGAFTQARVRVEVLQLDNFSGDISELGGLYVDAQVSGGEIDDNVVAYGADIAILQ